MGWICDGPLGGSATKNRTFVWWVNLADSRLTASGHLHAGADVLVRRVKWQFDRAVDGPWLLWNVPDVRFRWLAPCDVGSALAWGVRRSLSYQRPYVVTVLAQALSVIERRRAGNATNAFQAWQQASTMALWSAKVRLLRKFGRRYCQTFSTGFNSGE